MQKLVIVLAFLLLWSESRGKDKFLVVTDEWAPYVYKDGAIVKGFDYEVMLEVLSGMNLDVDFQLLPWKRCVFMIEQKEADAILDISSNDDRKKVMYFPDEKISESSSVFFYLKGKKFKYKTLQDLKGLKVGTMLGYEYSKEFSEATFFYKEPLADEEQNFKKLLISRIDLYLSNKKVGLFHAKKLGILEKVAYIPKVFSGGDNFVAFSRKPGHDKLAKDFSKKLKKFKRSPKYKEILRKYGQ